MIKISNAGVTLTSTGKVEIMFFKFHLNLTCSHDPHAMELDSIFVHNTHAQSFEAMNSLFDRSVYFGPRAQWRSLAKMNCISDVTCFREEKKVLDDSFVFARINSTIFPKFCFALNTGNCSKVNSENNLPTSWQDTDFCEDWKFNRPIDLQ